MNNMIGKYLVILAGACLAISLVACKSGTDHKKGIGGDTVKREVTSDRARDRILGIWVAVGEENATFVIGKDSIEYPDQNLSYKYRLIGDSMHIHYDGYDGNYSVTMKGGDTLVLTGDERQVYYRHDHAHAQVVRADKAAAEMLNHFYVNYITLIASDSDTHKQQEALQKRYCTDRLFAGLPKLMEKLDADPFLNAQDSRMEDLKTLSVKEDEQRPGYYVVSYGNPKVSINLRVVNADGKYKIDSVWEDN
jgi:hypothetical protein